MKQQNIHSIDLSIVLPARNEQSRLAKTVEMTADWCSSNALTWEIVIVENASTDGTLDIAEDLSFRFSSVRNLRCPVRGKGNAVRTGVLASRGRCVMFMDADGATPPFEIRELLSCIERGADVAIGSRVGGADSSAIVVRSGTRAVMSQVLNVVTRRLLPKGISDSQCGFKMFRQEAARRIFSEIRIGGWAFDIEVLYLAKLLGLTVNEVHISWEQQEGTAVGLVLDPVRILIDAARIPFLHRHSIRRIRSDVENH